MQSNLNIQLYKDVINLMLKIKNSVDNDNDNDLAQLYNQYINLLAKLKKTGIDYDPEVLALAKEIQTQIKIIIFKLKGKQEAIKKKLSTINNKKKIISAYGI